MTVEGQSQPAMQAQSSPDGFCILMCGHMPASIEQRYGDFGHMFEQLLRTEDAGEIWNTFYPTDDQWPVEGELESYKGIVVTGSASDSFSQEPWIVRLRTELATAAARGQRILGVCFGCQIMALALGGKAGRASIGLETGTRCVVFPPQPELASSLPWAAALPLGKNLFVHEMHQDCVQELPEGATVLGSSERTEVEAWSLGDHILCIQGHPEFSKAFMEELITWRTQNAPEALPPAMAQEALRQLEEQPVTSEDAAAWQRICLTFLTA